MYYDPNAQLYDLLVIAFGVVAAIFGYANTRKNGDTFVAVGAFIVAAVAWGWVYLN